MALADEGQWLLGACQAGNDLTKGAKGERAHRSGLVRVDQICAGGMCCSAFQLAAIS